ncbi:MAG: 2-amino-4-hydroxy-6-hydroxymethyldihydropteridine diphosphokinase [Xenococcaceae cyanobacterium]
MAKCALALGSNLGNSLNTVENALKELANIPGVDLIVTSSWYQTSPVGPPQPDYINACAVLEIEQKPEELLTILQAIELQFGRVRKEKWVARTLDLDILLYEDLVMQTPKLTIPHPYLTERAFVLVPLAEIAPNWVEPISKKAIAQLAKEVDCTGVRLIDRHDIS